MKTFKLIIVALFFVVIFIFSDIARAADDNVSLTTTVQLYIALSVSAGDTIAFGNLTPGSPVKGASGSTVSVTTSGADGYKLYIEDGVTGTNSSLLHTDDASTRVADYGGTIGTPTSWSGTGLGFCLYAGSNKLAKWGTGVTYDDANNKYAGVPETATEIMDKTTYSADPDLSYIGWEVDAPNNQKTGSYSGNVTISAIANLP